MLISFIRIYNFKFLLEVSIKIPYIKVNYYILIQINKFKQINLIFTINTTLLK